MILGIQSSADQYERLAHPSSLLPFLLLPLSCYFLSYEGSVLGQGAPVRREEAPGTEQEAIEEGSLCFVQWSLQLRLPLPPRPVPP